MLSSGWPVGGSIAHRKSSPMEEDHDWIEWGQVLISRRHVHVQHKTVLTGCLGWPDKARLHLHMTYHESGGTCTPQSVHIMSQAESAPLSQYVSWARTHFTPQSALSWARLHLHPFISMRHELGGTCTPQYMSWVRLYLQPSQYMPWARRHLHHSVSTCCEPGCTCIPSSVCVMS